jgi:uncharacterized protein involved in outer membrane biogenesis
LSLASEEETVKQKIVIGAIALLIVIAGVSVFLYNSIDEIVKGAIERFGTEITGTKVSVASVEISLKSGRGTIRGLKVHNPQGFSSDHALELGEITVEINVASLNKDPIIISEIRIQQPVVRAELDDKAKANVVVLKDHVEAYQAAAAREASSKRDSGYEKHFVIRSLDVEGGKIHADATRVGSEKRDIDLAPIHLADVGGSRGVTADVLGKTISNALFGQVSHTVADQLKIGITDKLKLEAKKVIGK